MSNEQAKELAHFTLRNVLSFVVEGLPEAALLALEKELETYRQKLSELQQHKGRFVLVRGDDIVDTFTSFALALEAGHERFGLEPFLVKQVRSVEPMRCSARLIDPYGTRLTR
jgi:hypothetical protein